MALEGQAQLEDAEAQQDEADGPDEGKNEVAQICNNRQRIVRREGRTDGHDRDQHKAGKHGVNALDPLFEFMIHAAFSLFSLVSSVENAAKNSCPEITGAWFCLW